MEKHWFPFRRKKHLLAFRFSVLLVEEKINLSTFVIVWMNWFRWIIHLNIMKNVILYLWDLFSIWCNGYIRGHVFGPHLDVSSIERNWKAKSENNQISKSMEIIGSPFHHPSQSPFSSLLSLEVYGQYGLKLFFYL